VGAILYKLQNAQGMLAVVGWIVLFRLVEH
jgi:hypothetical protein